MNKQLLQCLVLSIACSPVTLHAQPEDTFGVAFVIEKQKIELDFNGDTRDTDFDSLQLHWYSRLLSHLDGSIVIGYMDTSQPSNPVAAGQASSGNFFEFGVRGYYYRGDQFKLSSAINYRYASTGSSLSTQDINWSWHQGSVDMRAQLRITDYLELQAGAAAIAIDGEQRASGDLSQVTPFDEKSHLSGFAAAHVIIDRTGQIGLRIDSGAIRGGQLYFARWF